MPPARGQVTYHKTRGIRIWAVRGWGSGTPPARTPHTPWGEPHPEQAKRTALADTAQIMRPCPAALAAKGVADTAFAASCMAYAPPLEGKGAMAAAECRAVWSPGA